VSGGRWRLSSTGADGFIFDNEKWAHEVGIAPFRIAKAPVTNVEFAAFVRAGGYRNRQFWSAAGWVWREDTGAERPVYWLETEGGYGTWRRYQEVEPLAPHAPVMFVNWYEAEAWCRWAKRRLPTEAEWEAAALGEAAANGSCLADSKRRWPWAKTPQPANSDSFEGPLHVAAWLPQLFLTPERNVSSPGSDLRREGRAGAPQGYEDISKHAMPGSQSDQHGMSPGYRTPARRLNLVSSARSGRPVRLSGMAEQVFRLTASGSTNSRARAGATGEIPCRTRLPISGIF
jgi:formylglycine-generating enzyme required for sulfatase activity